ncbi:TonB-dependent receptor plug domain-containing protein [Synoicihabitans lomoniglobus]|uniref:TonB-dependent receptor n=1 Tax=Synoicihabitans lomoniglobus TaxID=2909285 RepID=A0AAE9ZUU2_9BACT|nr:TonB-dependent receptor [Opitutaceae bacterium LMO-M01]WED63205.1 TonB-dependent receptor [Opitutaceae bacterium LMO-M01]
MALATAIGTAQLTAQDPAADAFDFAKLSLEELLGLHINSVSRRPERVFDAAAAVHVVTSEDIERIVAFDLPEALRLAPGIQVAQIDASNYAVTARGFNDVYANKLLMMTDGRTLYTKLFSGTLWNHAPVFMPDIDRIEVVRGPGATLWGANAVNGVINAVTKDAHDTLGGLFSVAIGDNLKAAANVRYGWITSEHSATRVYASYLEAGNLGAVDDDDIGGWDRKFVGARHDWHGENGRSLMITAEARELNSSNIISRLSVLPPYEVPIRNDVSTEAALLLGRWTQSLGSTGEWSTQAYIERVIHEQGLVATAFTVMDIDSQYQFETNSDDEWVFGFNAHRESDNVKSTNEYVFSPAIESTDLVSAFAQFSHHFGDEFKLTLGSKFEHHSYTDWEIQPGVRWAWTPTTEQTIWGSVARAARTPSRAERGSSLSAAIIPPNPRSPLPTKALLSGNADFESEYLTAYELGYRMQVTPEFSVDLALFVNDYTGLRNTKAPIVYPVFTPIPHIVADAQVANGVSGTTHGGEINIRWTPSDQLTFDASYSAIEFDLEDAMAPGVHTASIAIHQDYTPSYETKLRGAWRVTPSLTFDAFLSNRGGMPIASIPAYTNLELRLAWSPRIGQRWEIVGQNLLDPHHAEFPFSSTFGGEVREIDRAVFLKFTSRF